MRKSRISAVKQRQLREHFVAGTTASTAAKLVGVNKTTAAYYYHRRREIVYHAIADATPFAGEIEVDESYFGGRRKGKRGRGAAGKVPVFGLLKRGGNLITHNNFAFCEPVANCDQFKIHLEVPIWDFKFDSTHRKLHGKMK